jgi:acyl-CoA thioesterase I
MRRSRSIAGLSMGGLSIGGLSIGGLLCAVVLLAIPGCGSRGDATPDDPKPGARPSSVVSMTPATSSRPRIVFLGDSLTAGLGLSTERAYPTLLQRRLTDEGFDYQVVNAGVSGDTSAGGLSRLDWALQGDVSVLVVALGGNDGLRGLPAQELQANLAQIIERAQARGIAVVLAGMEAPPNYGREYLVSFHMVYPALAKKYHVALVPFLLQGVAGIDALNQADGIHPTAAGSRIVADNVWTVLKTVAEQQRKGPPGS